MSNKVVDLRPEPESMIVTLRVTDLRRIVREELKAVLAEKNGTAEPTQLLRLSEAAKRLNQSKDWLYRHWREVGGKKLGPKSIRFAIQDLEKWLQSRRSA
jgi:predicted DNA-binding transcriptional regulator AlpA